MCISMRKIKKFIVISLICITVFIFSCAVKVKPDFIDSSFTYSAMEAGGIAILPVDAVTEVQADMTLRKEAALGLERKLSEKYPKMKIVGIQTTTVKLAEDGLAEKYAKALVIFQTTGVTDANVLEEIGKTLGARYLAIPVILKYYKLAGLGNEYRAEIEVKVWDVEGKRAVFQHQTKRYCKGGSKIEAFALAAKEVVEAFPKP